MPDTWTTNPPMLREALEGMGARCGVEPRVLRPREREWTCYLDSKSWQGDIYIHDIAHLYRQRPYINYLILVAVLGILAGLLWGKRFWRERAR